MASRAMSRHIAAMTALVAVLASACSGGTATTSADSRGYITGEGVAEQIAATDRRTLPEFSGRTLDGGFFSSREHRGSVLVVNVWGSWCPPCRKEAPVLQRVWTENRDNGVQFIGIDVRDDDASARAFERKFKITYPSITTADSSGPLLAFASVLPNNAVPSTLVIDPKGRVAGRVVGRTTYVTLKNLVEYALET